jgi:hypothetical protein
LSGWFGALTRVTAATRSLHMPPRPE